ncbi:MAG: Fe-S cluster assembly ATPase SufC [Candidatus Bipolaricaulia bacterium]
MSDQLVIRNLHANVEGNEIIKGLDLTITKGEVHAIMGPNGSGKSTLAYALMGHPNYEVTEGEVTFKGEDVLDMEPDERARLGMFLAFQYPFEISGVPMSRFILQSIKAQQADDEEDDEGGNGQNKMPFGQFRKMMNENLEKLGIDESFAKRYLNEGFSGGEKKRAEILQMLMLKPEIAILDETDSGLDIDSVRIVAEAVNSMRGPEFSCLAITHYQRILNYLRPDHVHVMLGGKIVKSGDENLANELEETGYEALAKEAGVAFTPQQEEEG